MSKINWVAGLISGVSAGELENIKARAALAKSLREEVMQEKGFAHAEKLQRTNITAQKEGQKISIDAAATESQQKRISDSFEVEKKAKADEIKDARTFELEKEKAKTDADYKKGMVDVAKDKNEVMSALNDFKERMFSLKAAGSQDKKSSDVERQKVINETITKAKELVTDDDVSGANVMLSGIGHKIEQYDKTPKKTGFFSDTPAEKGYRIVPIVEAVSGKNGLVGSATGQIAAASGEDPDKQRIDSMLSKKSKVSASAAPAKEDKGVFHGDVDLSNPLSRGFANAMDKKDKYNKAKYGHLRKE